VTIERRAFALLGLSTLALALCGCGERQARPVDLPPPVQANSLGVGDVFELQIVGEDKLPTTFTVAPDGTVDLPYIHRMKVEGLEVQQVAALVRQKLIDAEILTDPSVSVSVKQFNSKRVEVLGEVQKPGSFPLEPGMTLLRAISMAGGFNALADKDRVVIRRKIEGGIRAATVSVDDIMENRIPDVPLQAGDSINVEDRVF
jgi:protein involved in polysaccharide export with SLBB domain